MPLFFIYRPVVYGIDSFIAYGLFVWICRAFHPPSSLNDEEAVVQDVGGGYTLKVVMFLSSTNRCYER